MACIVTYNGIEYLKEDFANRILDILDLSDEQIQSSNYLKQIKYSKDKSNDPLKLREEQNASKIRSNQETGNSEGNVEEGSGNQSGQNLQRNEEAGTETSNPEQQINPPKEGEVKIEKDPAEIQKLKTSVEEGELILKSGKKVSGKKYSAEELAAIQKSVDNSKAKLGLSEPSPQKPIVAEESKSASKEEPITQTFNEFLTNKKGNNDYFLPKEKKAQERWINSNKSQYETLVKAGRIINPEENNLNSNKNGNEKTVGDGERLSPGTTKESSNSIERNAKEAIHLATANRTSSAASQEQVIENFAKEHNIWYPDYETKFGKEIDNGNEAIIYSDGTDFITKVSKIDAFTEKPTDFIDRLNEHNSFEGNVPYKVIGFARNTDGKFLFILKQEHIQTAREADNNEIQSELERRGYTLKKKFTYENNDFILGDKKKGNVLVDKDGRYYFIDTNIIRKNGEIPDNTLNEEKILDYTPEELAAENEKAKSPEGGGFRSLTHKINSINKEFGTNYERIQDIPQEQIDKVIEARKEQNPENFTGVNRAIIDREHLERGIDEIQVELRKQTPEIAAKARKDVESGLVDYNDVAERLKNNPQTATPEDVEVLKQGKMRNILNTQDVFIEWNKAKAQNDEALSGVLREQFLSLLQERENIDLALRKAGVEWHLLGKAFQGIIKDDFSITGILNKAKILNNGKELSSDVINRLSKLADEHAKAVKDLQDENDKLKEENKGYQEEIAKKQSELDYKEKALEARKIRRTTKVEKLNSDYNTLKEDAKKILQGTLSAGLNPEAAAIISKMAINRIAAGTIKLADVIDTIYTDLDKKISQREIRDAISGYGYEAQRKTKDDLTIQINDLKKQAKLLSQLEDAENGFILKNKDRILTEPSPEVLKLQKQVTAKMKEMGINPRSEASLKAYETRLKNQLSELQTKLDNGDYTKAPKRQPLISDKSKELKDKIQSLQDKMNEQLGKIEFENRPTAEKIAKWIVDLGRAVKLLSYRVYGKLTGAASIRLITTPIEDLISEPFSRIPGLSYIAGKAKTEGHFSAAGTSKMYAKLFDKSTYQKAFKKLLTGSSDLDIERAGKYTPKTILNYIGYSHGVFKEPVRIAHYELAMQKLYEHSIRNGINPYDPIVLTTNDALAREYANRSILMNNNNYVSTWRMWLRSLEHFDKFGKTSKAFGKGLSYFLQSQNPIVTVPTNYFKESTSYTFGVAKAAASLMVHATREGLKNLSPQDADYIWRNLKKGVFMGSALMAIGYMNPENVGGYYNPEDEKNKKGGVKTGGFRIFGYDIPIWLAHSPQFEAIHLGATIRKVHDYYNKNAIDESALYKSYKQSVLGKHGAVEQMPFLENQVRAAKDIIIDRNPEKFAGEWLRGMIIPTGLQGIATATDKDEQGNEIKRTPKTIIENLKYGVPGLRKSIPSKIERELDKDKQKAEAAKKETPPEEKITKLQHEKEKIEASIKFDKPYYENGIALTNAQRSAALRGTNFEIKQLEKQIKK